MKLRFLILVFLIGSSLCIYSQETEKKTNTSPEITLSFNIFNHGFIENLGFGVGLYHAFFNQKRCNLVTGLEYNSLINTVAFMINDDTNARMSYNYMGIPVYFRVNMGKKIKFFIEAGSFCDFIVFHRKLTPKETNIDNKIVFYKPDFGFSGGIGLRIPIKEYEILIKSDYKLGVKKFINFTLISHYNEYFRFTVGFKSNFSK